MSVCLGYHEDPDFEDKYIHFAIANQWNKQKIWEKSKLSTKLKFWECLQENYDVIEQMKNEHLKHEEHSVGMIFFIAFSSF